MLTTRNEDAASCLGTGSNVFKLEPLNHVDAWTLFCRKAFWNEANESCPPELETYAQSLVQRCAGLPLAIAAIGGLMSLKEKTALEWKKVQDSLSWELGNNPNLERMKNILLLSFHDLPYHLKYCFLYCSLFPEDYTMRRKKLIRLWVAEGFVEERRGLTLEEVSETYLNELICRSMLQVLEIHTHGTSKSLKVHDLMRDLSLSIGLEENFCMIYNGEGAIENMKARRLSIQSNSENISNCTSMARLRTLFWFPIDVSLSTSFSSMAPTFKLLRVLDLQASSITSVPKELCNLFSLRYLSLKETEVKKLPKSLGRLQNLQTLDLRDSKIEKLPRGIEKMKSLRHIYLSRYTRQFNSFHIVSGMQAPKGICKLKCLQSLVTVEANDSIIRLVGNLVQLRKFEVTNVRDVDGVPFCSSIQNMKCLLSLHVIAANEEETLQLESISSPPPLLQKLLLTGRMERLPDWVVSLRNLTFLSLIWTRMKEDPLSSLRALSNLVVLILNKAYDGQQLSFYTGCFPKLKVLYFAELASLNWIQIEEGAMPCLKVMYLIGCKELKMLPQGTEYLTDLQELYLREMPKELIERLDGDDYMKVEHVPCIWITENH